MRERALFPPFHSSLRGKYTLFLLPPFLAHYHPGSFSALVLGNDLNEKSLVYTIKRDEPSLISPSSSSPPLSLCVRLVSHSSILQPGLLMISQQRLRQGEKRNEF